MARSMIGLLLLFATGCGTPATQRAVTERVDISTDQDLTQDLQRQNLRRAREKIEEELLLNLWIHILYQKELLVDRLREAPPLEEIAYREVIRGLDSQAKEIRESLRIPD